ncbi:MAG: geranylgeranyl pyrophosphate synthase, partial [Phycisphaerales bacterium]|nr:geranylgeranyl pyrophosphate synthase [Phycisphaerales bacterium]
QAVDIIQSHVPIGEEDERTVLRGYHWKTAAYTFEGPMLSGALLAGLGDAAQAAVSRFAAAVGQAYQLHNDLLDLTTTARDGCDLVQGKRTPTLLRARLALPPASRRALDDRLETIQRAGASATGGRRAVQLAEDLRQDLLAGGAADRTQAAIDQLLADARAATVDPALPPRFAAATAGLLASMGATYFAAIPAAEEAAAAGTESECVATEPPQMVRT